MHSVSDITTSPEWKQLQNHYASSRHLRMRDMFAEDPKRFQRFSIEDCGLFLDYSKNRVTDETMALLMNLARARDVEGWRARMFNGEKINTTEDRAVLHVALRNRANTPIEVDGQDVMPDVNRVLERMGSFAESVRSGHWTGTTGKRIKDIVNIGIGGSDLGPKMVCKAMQAHIPAHLRLHFVSNVDGAHIAQVLNGVDWETTLFIVCSKTFTTQETMLNAHAARKWFMDHCGDEAGIPKHFVATTTNVKKAAEFGIPAENLFEFWDWVGGRYSLWSAVGLSIMLAIGSGGFAQLLSGAHEIDKHFRPEPLERNMPVILGMLGIWYNNFYGVHTHAILPYSQELRLFPDYLQQGDMESNGKSADRNGRAVDYDTGPVIWGKAGTDCQHSFLELLHQGTQFIPADFIASARPSYPEPAQHPVLMANYIAQTEALMTGRQESEVRAELKAKGLAEDAVDALTPHKIHPGNRPTNTILFDRLTPKTLGALVALYEHKIFVQGICWNLNSYDQWGVELGKTLAGAVLKDLQSDTPGEAHDASTNGLIARLRKTL
ncbi:MAG: glucose-6-phosphate isomerase [Alphaproteobacteria bacterium]|nr:glucose-6-phosphate isomerase [Alphaproteobacteria bacterium]